MTIDKNTWQALAEKYDTKAKWAEALLFLNTDEHEDLISALIELSPEDILKKSGNIGSVHINVSDPVSSVPDVAVRELDRLDVSELHLSEEDVKIDTAQKAFDIATAVAQDVRDIQARLDDIDSQLKVDPEDILKILRKSVKDGLSGLGNASS